MKKIYIFLFLVLAIVLGAALVILRNRNMQKNVPSDIQNNASQSQNVPVATDNQAAAGFQSPLNRASERLTKKPFGIYITLQNSPVQPERFQGYHTGKDFEIFPEELDTDISVHAVCSGKLLLKEYASGYGGVVVQSCELENNTITVVYGHLKLASIAFEIGDNINIGDEIGILGRANSTETDGERKHLHLGFHKGAGINIKGYVANQSELSGWIDPCLYLCKN